MPRRCNSGITRSTKSSSPAGIVGADPVAATATISHWGFPVSVTEMADLAGAVGERTLLARTGGAPSLAVGMASIFSRTLGGAALLRVERHDAPRDEIGAVEDGRSSGGGGEADGGFLGGCCCHGCKCKSWCKCNRCRNGKESDQ